MWLSLGQRVGKRHVTAQQVRCLHLPLLASFQQRPLPRMVELPTISSARPTNSIFHKLSEQRGVVTPNRKQIGASRGISTVSGVVNGEGEGEDQQQKSSDDGETRMQTNTREFDNQCLDEDSVQLCNSNEALQKEKERATVMLKETMAVLMEYQQKSTSGREEDDLSDDGDLDELEDRLYSEEAEHGHHADEGLRECKAKTNYEKALGQPPKEILETRREARQKFRKGVTHVHQRGGALGEQLRSLEREINGDMWDINKAIRDIKDLEHRIIDKQIEELRQRHSEAYKQLKEEAQLSWNHFSEMRAKMPNLVDISLGRFEKELGNLEGEIWNGMGDVYEAINNIDRLVHRIVETRIYELRIQRNEHFKQLEGKVRQSQVHLSALQSKIKDLVNIALKPLGYDDETAKELISEEEKREIQSLNDLISCQK